MSFVGQVLRGETNDHQDCQPDDRPTDPGEPTKNGFCVIADFMFREPFAMLTRRLEARVDPKKRLRALLFWGPSFLGCTIALLR